jgi:PAS domain S-box-containing protein
VNTLRTNILLLENDTGDADYIKKLLSGKGKGAFNLVWKNRLEKGLPYVRRGVIDIVLMNGQLSDCSGLETIKKANQTECSIPIIVMIGSDDKETARQAVTFGADDYVFKSAIDRPLLEKRIRKSIENKRVGDELQQKSQDLSLINSLNSDLVQGKSLKEIGNRLTKEIKQTFGTSAVALLTTAADTNNLTMKSYDMSHILGGQVKNVIGKNISALQISLSEDNEFQQKIKSGQMQVIKDPAIFRELFTKLLKVRLPSRISKNIFKFLNINSVAVIPLFCNTELQGILNVASAGIITEKQTDRLEFLTKSMASIIWHNKDRQALELRGKSDGLKSKIFSDLVGIKSEDMDKCLKQVLEAIGKFLLVDRSYIFLFRKDKNIIDNTHEWCAKGIKPQIGKLKGLNLDKDFPWFAKRIRNFENVNITDVNTLPPDANSLRAELKAEQIQSLIIVPLTNIDGLLGFIGFDSVKKKMVWEESTIQLLRSIGEIVSKSLESKKYEETLKYERDLLKTLMDHIPDNVYFKDVGSRFTHVNKSQAMALGLKDSAAALRKTDFDFFKTEFSQTAIDDEKKIIQSGKPILDKVEKVEQKNDSLRWFSASKVPIKSRDGKVVGLVGISRDITQHKLAKDREKAFYKLKEKLLTPASVDDKLKTITDGVVDIFNADIARIWITKEGDQCFSDCFHANKKNGPHVCRCKDRCLHLTSSSGRYTHIDGETHKRVPMGCYTIGEIAAGNAAKYFTNDAPHDKRVYNHRWAKQQGLVSFVGYRLISNESKSIGVLALFSKNTISSAEELLLEELAISASQVIQTDNAFNGLLKSQQRYKQLFHEAPVGYHEINVHGKITRINKTELDMLGFSEKEMIGKPILDFVDEKFARIILEKKLSKELPPGDGYERTFVCKDGKKYR